MRFHKEGKASIILAIVVSLTLLLSANYWFGDNQIINILAIAIAAVLMIVVLQFFRNPPRRMVIMDDAIIAPCDGKVVVIEEVEDPEYFKGKVRQISVFMSPTNVHINWFPISGKTVYSQYHKGKFLVAWHPKSSTDNERHSIVTQHPKHGEILTKQIAGAIARRIVNYANVGDESEQCEELGFIKFGSRVDILIPLDAKVDVSLNEATVGGQTILATFN